MARSFLTVTDVGRDGFLSLLSEADALKRRSRLTVRRDSPLEGRLLGLIFQKPSTRTRVSFEAAMERLGGRALYLGWSDLQLGRGETVADTARVLSRYLDAIAARVFAHSTLEELSRNASVPVINALSDSFHPCQALADMLTIKTRKGALDGVKLAWVGDGNNVCHSLMLSAGLLGLKMRIATPKGYEPDGAVVERARMLCAESGGEISLTTDPQEAVADADVVYTDVWASMGQEDEAGKRRQVFAPYQVNAALMELANKDAIFMHCLPAHRGDEVTGEVIDGRWSVVWEQAENRMWVQMALLLALLREGGKE